ncbi:cell filamentation protein Fic [Candidatus Kaiserbacteria bacterium]|nr:cell filamentation protein Fic [Candidatus Kaiserbacteria bacterium]
MDISSREQKIIAILLKSGPMQSSALHKELVLQGDDISLVTVKRTLASMTDRSLLTAIKSGRSSSYAVGVRGRVFVAIDAHAYCTIEPDQRHGLKTYNFNLFEEMPVDIFSTEEINTLTRATAAYEQRTTDVPPAIAKRELERLIIELSWKSSKIEGNTYTLLDTEKLILEHKEAVGHDKAEAQMILNHKDAFTFVHEHSSLFQNISRANIEQLHAILVKDLGVGIGLRKKPVGITGSTYQPLDNIYQISEGIEALASAVSRMDTPYAQALIALLGISYLQPFEDGNKRTARLLANAILLAHGRAPLSYRSVEENEYREATMVFYELNSIIPFKRIFVEQYDFAARTYAVK